MVYIHGGFLAHGSSGSSEGQVNWMKARPSGQLASGKPFERRISGSRASERASRWSSLVQSQREREREAILMDNEKVSFYKSNIIDGRTERKQRQRQTTISNLALPILLLLLLLLYLLKFYCLLVGSGFV